MAKLHELKLKVDVVYVVRDSANIEVFRSKKPKKILKFVENYDATYLFVGAVITSNVEGRSSEEGRSYYVFLGSIS